MAYISHKKLWESKFDNMVSNRDKLQDLGINQLKFKIQENSKKR